MNKPNRHSPEVKERAIRMVFDHQGEYGSQWATIRSIAEKDWMFGGEFAQVGATGGA